MGIEYCVLYLDLLYILLFILSKVFYEEKDKIKKNSISFVRFMYAWKLNDKKIFYGIHTFAKI